MNGIEISVGWGDHAILAVTEAGEDQAVNKYKKALEEISPRPCAVIVSFNFKV